MCWLKFIDLIFIIVDFWQSIFLGSLEELANLKNLVYEIWKLSNSYKAILLKLNCYFFNYNKHYIQ